MTSSNTPNRILVLNPNSSKSMTDGLKPVIDSAGLPASTTVGSYTGPESSPASINDDTDLKASTEAVLADIKSRGLPESDGIVVACFSVHPLVSKLHAYQDKAAVIGIFEAAVLTAISLLEEGQKWGIVTTGKFWEEHLTVGAKQFLGFDADAANGKFAGVESTGLNAGDFHHGVDPAVVRQKLKEATKRVLHGGKTTCIVMGCAGMAGLDEIIRETAAEEVDEDFAYNKLHVVDGVRSAIMHMDQMIKLRRLRPGSSK